MTNCTVVPASEEHARWLGPRLREEDRREVAAASGRDPTDVLLAGLGGDVCLTGLSPEGEPMTMGGVYPDPEDEWAGQIWLLASPVILRHQITFLRRSRELLGALDTRYRLLWNRVDARNEVHMKWIRWMGFTFIRRIPQFGVERRPFYEFARINHV